MKRRFITLALILIGFICSACGDNDPNGNEPPAGTAQLQLLESYPEEGASCTETQIVVIFTFDRSVSLLDKSKVRVNGSSVSSVAAIEKQVKISLPLVAGNSYEVALKAGSIGSETGSPSTKDYVLHFSCAAAAPPEEGRRFSSQAANLMDYLKEINGRQILSGATANVAWNTNEAQWIYSKTGRYPAINCYDYIHLHLSGPGNWIDYSNIQELEEWWKDNGLVSASWHWNVPANNGSGYAFYAGGDADKTSFDVRKIFDTASAEYKIMISDIDKIGDHLLLLQKKEIPVLWRPLHEAGGAWFWWGTDAAGCKELWKIMYERFKARGLDNLIWVWTPAVAWNQDLSVSLDWYPGDEYVDIVGYDIYNADSASCLKTYNFLRENWPDKLTTMSECGNVPPISDQWNAGSHWLWFAPWYDYNRTNSLGSDAFKEDRHEHADAAWWQAAMSDERVISRDEVPSLK